MRRGRNIRVSGEDAVALIPVIVVELPDVHVPLPVVGIPVDVHDTAASRARIHPCHRLLIRHRRILKLYRV